ncbi:MAG: hypothetical protein ABSB32_17070, partial [Thermodesulfobacteriota bacterium]
VCHDLRPCQTCRKRPPLRSERMPFIPRLESLGFSGIAYKLMEIQFIHVYGKIGYLPWERNFTYGAETVDYGNDRLLPGQLARRTQELIDLIYDERKNNPEIQKARKLISDANRIMFLGFGYDEMNLSILELPRLLEGKLVLGTAINSTRNEIGQIMKKLDFGKLLAGSKILDCDCLMLLREHLA